MFSLGQLWASFWEPWGHLGLPRGPPWRHFGLPLAPLGLRGAIWGTLGSQRGAWNDFGRPIPSKWLSSSAPANKKWPRGTQRTQRPMGAKWRRSHSSQPHFTRAGGQDDGSLDKLPQINKDMNTIINMNNNNIGVGDHFQVLRVPEGSILVVRRRQQTAMPMAMRGNGA